MICGEGMDVLMKNHVLFYFSGTGCYCFCPQVAITFMKKPHNLKRGLPYRGPVEQFQPRVLLGRR